MKDHFSRICVVLGGLATASLIWAPTVPHLDADRTFYCLCAGALVAGALAGWLKK